MTATISHKRSRAVRMAVALVGLGLSLGACVHDDRVQIAAAPDDYRLRHPIAIEEANHSIVVFVGQGRGGLSAEQRTDVMGLAQSWHHEATGAISADVPVDTPNARAAADAFREIQSLLAAAGVPPHGVVVRHYHPDNPRHMAAIRLSYPKLRRRPAPADCGPRISAPRSRTRATTTTRTTTITAAPISATWPR